MDAPSTSAGRPSRAERPELSVLIVTYNSADHIEACLRALPAAMNGRSAEVIVIDNASADSSVEVVRSFPDVRLFLLEKNLGFAQAVNIAAGHATGEYLLLVNPDATLHPGAADALVAVALERPEHGLYGGRVFGPDGRSHSVSCLGIPSLWSTFCFATGLSTILRGSAIFDPESVGRWDRQSECEVPAVSGCLLLASRQLWDALGGFDPTFFLYGEDVDLALRARRLGFRPVVTPLAALTHHVGASSATPTNKLVLLLKGKITLLRKHWPPWRRRAGMVLLALGVALRAAPARALPKRLGEGRGAQWLGAWKRRSEWLEGYEVV